MVPEHADGATTRPGETDDRRLARARPWVAVAGIAAGLLAFGIGEIVYELIPAENGTIVTIRGTVVAPTTKTNAVAEVRNAALTFGILGACLGGCLGRAGGLARKSATAALLAGGLGIVLAAAAGAGLSLVLLPLFMAIAPGHLDYEVFLSTAMHGSIWGPVGAAAGLAFVVGLGEPKMLGRAMVAGFTGAALGTIAYEIIGAAFFPLESTGHAISTSWQSRLTARFLVAVGTAGLVMLSLPGASRAKSARGRAPAELPA